MARIIIIMPGIYWNSLSPHGFRSGELLSTVRGSIGSAGGTFETFMAIASVIRC